jgi:3-hydroxy acid dehydrogenase/malonic semialdehyde reductase
MLVAVTGASSGIGAAIARKFHAAGAQLILVARDQGRLRALAGELGNASGHSVDLTDRKQIERLFESIPTPDVWINNAGIAKGQKPLDATPADDIDEVLNTNLMGALHACRLAAGRMRERGTGHIVNITSAAAFNPYRGGNAYAISKAAVHMLTQCLRHDLGRTRIRVSEIAPGIVGDTDFIRRRFQGDLSKYEATYGEVETLTSEDVADAVHYCVSAPARVNVDLMVLFPVQQHGGGVVHKRLDPPGARVKP